jgi:DNA-binding SARP family transcriptional activator
MIAAGQQRRRLRALTRVPLSLAILALLWMLRPGKPSLPGSLSAPLTVEAIESVILWLLWLAVGLLALVLMFTALRQRSRPLVAVRGLRGSSTRPPWRAYGTRARPASPLFVVSAPLASASLANGRTVVSEQRSAECAAPASDAIALHVRPQVSVLGPLTIAGAKRSRRGLRKAALELVAYLALHRRPVQRDELLEAFWPGVDPRRTRSRLHQAVRDARRLLGTAIASDRDCYWLERAEVDVDLDQLERFLAEARVADGDQVEQQLLEQALGLFVGEPLAGSDYPWSEGELRRLRATHVELLERVGRTRLGSGEPRRSLELAERALALDGLNEGLWRLALEAESALGLREAVDERYERLRTLLAERLGLEPDRETRSLYRGLLAQG